MSMPSPIEFKKSSTQDASVRRDGAGAILQFPAPTGSGDQPQAPSLTAPIPARKRGKRMSRRKGQNPKVRVGKRADGTEYYFFQY